MPMFFRGQGNFFIGGPDALNGIAPAVRACRSEALFDGAPKIVFAPGGSASSDSYFNGFSLGKWKTCTDLRDLKLRFTVKGGFLIQIYHVGATIEDDTPKLVPEEAEKIAEELSLGGERRTVEIELPIAALENGQLYWKLTALELGCELFEAEYLGESAEAPNPVRIAIGICTFNRDEYLFENLDALSAAFIDNADSPLNGKLRVFVSDNAGKLPPSEKPGIDIFHNPNLGGAGGFTRCLIEAKFKSDFHPTHIILMDDDVRFRAGTFEVLFAFLSMLKKEYSGHMFGGALFYQDEPNRQYVAGEFLEFDQWKPLRHNLDMENFLAVCVNDDVPADVSYNGWWFCCIPESYVTASNLPLPIFLHFDDKEYPIRNHVPFIHLNGVCVWHPRFSNKQAAATLGYYNSRNAYIFMAETAPERLTRAYLRRMLLVALKSTLYYRYNLGFLQIRAVDDFLRGIDAFKSVDTLKLHAELSAFNDRWLEWNGDSDALLCMSGKNKSKTEKFKLLLNCLLPGLRRSRCYQYSPVFPGVFLKKEVTIVDTAKGVCVTYRKDAKKLLANLKYLLAVCLKLHRTKAAVREWNRRIGEVQSLDFWEKYLDLE